MNKVFFAENKNQIDDNNTKFWIIYFLCLEAGRK